MWQGGGMHGREGVHGRGGHVLWGGMCGRGRMCGGHVWHGACMTGGVHGRGCTWWGHAWQGACVAGGHTTVITYLVHHISQVIHTLLISGAQGPMSHHQCIQHVVTACTLTTL